MAQTIEQFIASGDIEIGALDSKSRIAPVTQNGKPVLLTLSASPELSTPFSPWPSYDGGERCSIDLRMTPQLGDLADHLDEMVQRVVGANPTTWFSKPPKNLDTKCSLRDKGASFKAWDLERREQLTVDQLKSEVDWPNSCMAIVAQLSGVYFQASGYGPVLNLKSVGLRTASAECPFEWMG